jgi:sugar lactone lactonase YvrE
MTVGRPTRAHRLQMLGRFLALGLAALCMLQVVPLMATPAQAATTHPFLSRVTEAPLGSALREPGPATVDRATGQVFMTDPGAGDVDVFSSTGTFVTQFGEALEPTGVAVDESTGLVYVASGTSVLVFKPTGKGGYALLSEWEGAGTPTKEFGTLADVAFDNSKGPNAGDLYVLDATNNAVELFKPKPPGPEEAKEGAFLSALKGPKLEEPNALALDVSTGKLYVADSPKGLIDIYSSSGVFEVKINGAGSPEGAFKGPEGEEGNVKAIAAEEGTLYVAEAERHVVSQFNSAGEWSGWVTGTPAPFSEPDGVAAAPSGALYVADALAGQLDRFGPGVLVPDAQTEKASKIAKTTATLNGTVNGDGKAAKYRFEYGPTEAYGSLTPTQSAGPGEEKVKAEVSGLTAGAAYHFRLITENEAGTNYGADRELETRPAVEGLATGPVQNLKPTEATLTGTLSPNGVDAHYLFQWGISTAYGNATESTDAGSAKEAVPAKATLTGLAPNTTYHYRLIGSDNFGQTTGEDKSFTTSGPPQIQSEPTSAITHEAATLNAKIDPGELETSYHFEYGTTTAYGTEVPAGKLAAGEAFAPVSAPLTGLKIGTVYHFRVVGENSAGKTIGPDQVFETVPPALIEGTSTIEVSSSAATLEAQVNPLGHDSTYYFQYGTAPCKPEPAACTDIPAAPGTDIGAGEVPVPVAQKAEGLKASTTYHYRALAINSLGTSEGPERTITTQPGEAPFALADNRAWEMVSPPNKHGAPVEALTREGGLILAAEDGSSLTYVADGSIVEEPQGQRSPEMQQDISRRTPEGWVTQDIATPQTKEQGVSAGQAPEYQYFTPDLSLALVQPWATTPFSEPPLAPEAKQATMYVRNDAAGAYLPLVTEGNVTAGTEFGQKLHFLSATSDLSHVLLRSDTALTSPPSGKGPYEWTAGQLRFVSLLPNGTPASEAELGFDGHVLAHAVSSDGSRILWTSKDENSGAGHLYVRDTATSQTLQLDAAQGVAEPGTGSAEFQTASADGSKVFFTDKQKLTADSTAQPTFPEKADLYECEVVEETGKLACHLKDLTVDHNSGEHAAVRGFVLGAGEDGTSVYLVAQGVLAGNEDGNGEKAEAGGNNLYELHFDGASWSTTFIAQLSSEDSPEWEGNRLGDTAFLTARVSPNGRYLAFMSNASLTGYDNRDQASGKRDEEVYLYDSQEARLTCVSCNATGGRPHGVLDTVEAGEGLGLVVDRRKVWAEQGHEHWLAGNIPGWTAQSLVSALFQSRYLNDEGRLYFNSPDHLVQQAKSGKESVYEYEPSGVGSCASSSGGCVSLISSGSSSRESAFLEATPSGNDVFFLTAAQLLPQDTDTAFDIYDARVCTSASPCLTPPISAPPGCSTANACRPSEPGQQAPLGPSGSATVNGQGNVSPQPQPRGEPLGTKSVHPKSPTRVQQLANALKACKKIKSKKKRVRCEARARKRWSGKANAKKTNGRPAWRGR